MSSGSGLEDFSLMDLFRSEVETHSEVLSAALLELERSPGDPARLEEMMRAAHSIKGAARVVGVDAAVGVSHVMEDCFVAAQRGTLTLSPGAVDVLLRGVDLLGKISEATRDPQADMTNLLGDSVKPFVVELEAMLAAGGMPAGAAASAGAGPRPSPIRLPGAVAASTAGARPSATSPGAVTIAVPEILDAAAAEEIRQQFVTAIERGCDPIRLDLRTTKDLDVTGLALLAGIPRHAARHGRPRPQLAGVSAEMETVLVVTGLDGSYDVGACSSSEDA